MPLDVARLRDPRLTNVNRYRVSHLVYASGGATLSASRKDDATWITDAGITIPGERIYTLLVALLEAETVSWADGSLDGPLTATLTYAQGDEGASGRLEFSGDRASWDALPGIVFRLASSAPPVPTGPR
jgi:hypothetical protein